MTNRLGEIDLEEAAEQAAGNWRKFQCFVWYRDEIQDAENWAIVYTNHRDSGLLDQSNAAAIQKELESPWSKVEANYPVNTLAKGTVTKLMDFGAFVELEPGVEGLVHISELSHKRVWRPSDVVKEGQEVDVMIQSVDADAQRISLSMKDASAEPESEKTAQDDGPGEAAPLPKGRRKQISNKPLKGGVGKGGGGEQFGLKW